MATYLLIGMVVAVIGMLAMYCFKIYPYKDDYYKSDMYIAMKHTPMIFAALIFGWPVVLVMYFVIILTQVPE